MPKFSYGESDGILECSLSSFSLFCPFLFFYFLHMPLILYLFYGYAIIFLLNSVIMHLKFK